jgi:predicted enzyme related to lactoylglutathione lyase
MFVDDIEAEHARLEALGVTFIRSMGREQWGGVFSTFSDPDGNLLQIAEFKPGG